jgi:hypothetical protein
MELKEKISFTKEECEYIIRLSEKLPLIEPYVSKSDKFKVNYTAWKLILDNNSKWIFDKVTQFFTYETNLKIKKELSTLYIHKYNVGQQFEKHNDTHYKTQIHNVGVCLNDDYEGGEFILYNPEKILPKRQGELYTFPSARFHEVKQIVNGERWSIIGFLHMENIDLSNKTLI